jgi:hypothetical protein
VFIRVELSSLAERLQLTDVKQGYCASLPCDGYFYVTQERNVTMAGFGISEVQQCDVKGICRLCVTAGKLKGWKANFRVKSLLKLKSLRSTSRKSLRFSLVLSFSYKVCRESGQRY